MQDELIHGMPNWVMLLLGGGLATTLSGKVREWLLSLMRGFIVSTDLDTAACQMLMGYLKDNPSFKFFPLNRKYYISLNLFVQKRQRHEEIMVHSMMNHDSTQFFLTRFWPAAISFKKEGHEPVGCIRYIRGTLDIEQMLIKASERFNSIRHSRSRDRFEVKHIVGSGASLEISSESMPKSSDRDNSDRNMYMDRYTAFSDKMLLNLEGKALGINPDDLGWRPTSGLESMILSKDIENIVEDIRYWLENEEWFKERAIPWRRGYLLSGPPGTGKTSFIRSVGMELSMPVFVFDLASFSNKDMIDKWKEVQKNAPCILVLEDIDSVFTGRENMVKATFNNPLSFDCLLQCLDGVAGNAGVLLFITSNHPETLDSAINTERPGRIDACVHFPYLDESGIRKMTLRILKGFSSTICEKAIEDLKKNQALTPAQAQEHLFKIALESIRQK